MLLQPCSAEVRTRQNSTFALQMLQMEQVREIGSFSYLNLTLKSWVRQILNTFSFHGLLSIILHMCSLSGTSYFLNIFGCGDSLLP